MIRLGWRLATAGGRGAIAGISLTALAVGLGTAILLFALSFWPAVDSRTDRAAWRDAAGIDGATTGTWYRAGEDRYGAQTVWSARVAAEGSSSPVPPGIPALPGPGESYVSPALAALIGSVPYDQLGVRYGTVLGTVGDEALRAPDELVAIVGMPADRLRADAQLVSRFPEHGTLPEVPPLGIMIVAFAAVGALVPVAVFVASATRLSAARREQRLAALRLVGATPRQAALLASVEAFAAAGAGAIVGIGLFLLLRPLVARIPLAGVTWFPETIAPPLLQAAALLAVVPIVGVAAALVSLRRVTISPLGVQRRVASGRPRLVRLVPLIASTGLFLLVVPLMRGSGPAGLGFVVVIVAFAGIIIGIAVAGPLLTALVGELLGRIPAGGATLLAARRLVDDPRSSFGSIAGVVMATFVATTFLTFADIARSEAGPAIHLGTRPGTVAAFLSPGAVERGAALGASIVGVPGVTAVVDVRRATIAQGDNAGPDAWIADCSKLLLVLETGGAGCGTAPVLTTAEVPSGTGWHLVGQTADGADAPVATIAASVPRGPADTGLAEATLSAAIVDPSVVPDVDAFAVTQVFVATDGTPAAEERVRSAILAIEPFAAVGLAEERFVANPVYEEVANIVVLGLLMTMLLAGSSLAVAVTTAVAERRRQFVFLRSAGMPASSLRAVVLLQAGVPLVAVAAFSALLGTAVAEGILVMLGVDDLPLPGIATLALLAASVGVAMAVVALTLPGLERMTRPASLRVE